MDLDQLEKEVKKRKQGMITLENVYVVLLVAAWASIVLLIIILIIGVTIALHLPPNFGNTITDGYQFFLTVANGWNAGVLEISKQSPNSQSPSNIEYMISELVQLIHGLDVPALLHVCPTDNIVHSINFLMDIPSFVENAKDIVSFSVTNVKWLPLVGALLPLEYYFPTNRQAPPTMQLTMDREQYSVHGFWSDMNTVEFSKGEESDGKWIMFDDIDDSECTIYDIKPYLKAFGYHTIKPSFTNYVFDGNIAISDALRHGILMRNEITTNNVKEFRLSLDSVKFYYPIIVNATDQFLSVILNKTVPLSPSDEIAHFENDVWNLNFDPSISGWVLCKKQYESYVYDRFRDILPLKLHQEIMQTLPHNKIGNVTIQQITVDSEDREYNGRYTLYEPTHSEPTVNGIKIASISNDILDDEDTTIYFREILQDHKIYHYQLIHHMHDGTLHKWILKKFVIETKYAQHQTCLAQIESDSLIIHPLNHSNWTLQTNSQFEDESLGYIESIVIEYVLNPVIWYSTVQNVNVDRNIRRQYVCAPAVHFKSNTMHLKMKTRMSMFEWIPIAMQSINVNELRCQATAVGDEDMETTYLMMKDVTIRSDMFGGITKAKVHFRFKNRYICQQFIKTVQLHHDIGSWLNSEITLRKLVARGCEIIQNQKETHRLVQIAMDELEPKLKRYQRIVRWFLVIKTPEQLCGWIATMV